MEDLDDRADRNEAYPVAATSECRPHEHVSEQQDRTTSAWRRALHRPDFYGVVIAAIALLVSLLPPALSLVKGTSVEISIASTALLTTHAIGYPSLNIHIGVENIGGRSSTIRQFSCDLTHVETERNWPMEVYVSLSPSSNSLGQPDFHPLGWISIKAGEVWSGVVRCESWLSDDDRVRIDRIIEKFDQSIQQQLASRVFPTSEPAKVPDNLTGEAISLFDKRFELLAGTYKITMTSVLAQSEADVTATRHFIVTPLAIDQLRRIKDDFPSGAGIFYPSRRGGTTIRLSRATVPSKRGGPR